MALIKNNEIYPMLHYLLAALLFMVPLLGEEKKSSSFKEQYVQVEEAELFCRIMGQGDPLVVIHGGPGLTQDYLLPQMDKLAEKNLVIFYDQRGSGRSTGAINTQSMQVDTFVSDLENLRKALGFKKISIVGHSWGGFLAMQYSLSHPESVDKLILLNSLPASSQDCALFRQEWASRMQPYQAVLDDMKKTEAFALGDPDLTEKYFEVILRRYCYDPEKVKELSLRQTAEANLKFSQVAALFEKTLFATSFDYNTQLQQLKIPTLIVHGDGDIVPYPTAERLHKIIPGSKYVLMEKCGHFPYVENPGVLFPLLDEFLHSP